jgi:PKD repeat protein
MSKEPLDSFEKSVQDSYKNYELPFLPSTWSSLSRAMLVKRLFGSAAFWGVSVLIVGSLVFGGSYYLGSESVTAEVPNSSDLVKGNEDENSTNSNANNTNSAILEPNQTTEAEKSLSLDGGKIAEVTDPLNQNLISSEINQGQKQTEDELNVLSDLKQLDENETALSIVPSIRSACAGAPIDFSSKNSADNGSYLWNFGDGSFSTEENPTHTFKKSGMFDISLSITNPKDGQISSVVMTDLITILPSPEAKFAIEFSNYPTSSPSVKMVNLSNGIESFQWNFSNGTTSTEESPVGSFGLSGRHTSSLEVVNSYGCSDTETMDFNINPSKNKSLSYTFSKKNINFLPKEFFESSDKIELSIFQDGSLIFESTKANKPWTGETINNQVVKMNEKLNWILVVHSSKNKVTNYFQGNIEIVP